MTFSAKIALLASLLVLASCISGKPPSDSYTDQSGKTTIIESDREQCERACNADYSRCMDTEPAQTNPVDGAPRGMFGASSDCRAALSSCLPDCKSR
jgi:hypothetical protein